MSRASGLLNRASIDNKPVEPEIVVTHLMEGGMGVVSGIVMAYQFGTNWSAFADKTGAVIGPLMAYEVLTAFSSRPASSA